MGIFNPLIMQRDISPKFVFSPKLSVSQQMKDAHLPLERPLTTLAFRDSRQSLNVEKLSSIVAICFGPKYVRDQEISGERSDEEQQL